MPIPLSVQLYSLREEMKDGKHLPYLTKLAALGYKGVETAGFYGLTPSAYKKLVEDHGMTVSGTHAGLPEAGKEQALIDEVRALGLTNFIVPWISPDEWKTVDSIKRLGERLEKTRQIMAKANIDLLYHNHDFELRRIEGKTGLEHLVAAVPNIKLEIDTYWAANFGAEDPAKIVSQFKNRTPFLHLKDGPLTPGAAMTAVGSGKQNMSSIVKAADPAVTKWLVVELDACDGDMWKAIEDSYHYLVGSGLAAGNKPAKAISKK
jgi:sugar phosphate isomerase/epimerase